MRDTLWAKLVPGNPDRDVIAKPFFTLKKNVWKFKSGRAIIYFEVSSTIYNTMMAKKEAEELEQAETMVGGLVLTKDRNVEFSIVAADFTVGALHLQISEY